MAYLAQPALPTSPTAGRPGSRHTNARSNTSSGNPSEMLTRMTEQLQDLDIRHTATAERVSTLDEQLMLRVDGAYVLAQNVERVARRVDVNLNVLHDKVREGFTDVRDELDGIHQEITDTSAYMHAGFTDMNRNFLSMDRSFAIADRNFENVDRNFDNMNRNFEKIGHNFKTMDRNFEFVGRNFEKIDRNFETIDHNFKTMDRNFEFVGRQLANLDQKLDLLLHALQRPQHTEPAPSTSTDPQAVGSH